LTSLTGANKFTLQRVFWIPNSPTNAFLVYYGNAVYGTLIDAQNGVNTEAFTEAPNTALNAIQLATIVIESNSTDLTTANKCTIVQAGLFRSVGGIGSGGTTPVVTSLDSLSDVAISGPSQGDLLTYGNGTQWVNSKTLVGAYTLSGSLTTNDGLNVVSITASNISASSITGSHFGTSSWATSALTASNLVTGNSYIITNLTASNISASGTISASVFVGPHTGSTFGTSSWAQNVVSASFALTSSYINPSGNAFVQGGNSFGTTALLGTNDANSLAFETNGSTRMTINSGGQVGIGVSPISYYKTYISDTHTASQGSASLYVLTTQNQGTGATSANDSGITSYYTVNALTSSVSQQNQASYNQLAFTASGSYSGSYRSVRNGILFVNTASFDINASLVNTYLTNQIGASIPNFSINNFIIGDYVTASEITPGTATGSIASLYGYYIGTPWSNGTGIVTTSSFGAYISSQKSGTNGVVTGYGIYQVGTSDLNIFAGRTRIGSTTSPVNTLDVSGNISASVITASLFFGTASLANTASSLIPANSYTITNLTATGTAIKWYSASTGGSALASEEIWREVMLTQKKKKVYVSMGDVAASGGYYIATPADRIFAEPTTITGSIGVFGMIPYTGKMLENKLGITFDRVQTHNHSVMSTNRKLTPEELAMVQNEVNGIYSQFMDRVAKGRSLSVARVNQIARGRVWTGKDALSIGLVDELGSLTDVINFAKREIKDKDAKVIYYPKVKEDKFGSIIKMIKQENEEEESRLHLKNSSLPNELLEQYERIKAIESKMGIQMRMPYDLVFRF
jgi:signal peptide peptidase SppA